MKKLIILFVILFGFGYTAEAQIIIGKNTETNVKDNFYGRLQDKNYQKIQLSAIPTDYTTKISKAYRGAKIEKAYKNKEGVYGVVLFYPRERKVPSKIQKKATGRLKIDTSRQIVFFDQKYMMDEKSFPGDMFIPGDMANKRATGRLSKRESKSFPGDMFIPGSQLLPKD